MPPNQDGRRQSVLKGNNVCITNRANAHVPICPFSNRLDSKRRGRGTYSVDDALSLINLNDKASFVEDLLFYRSDDGLRIERPADDPAGQFDAEYDAYLLIRQLQRPTNHVGELHRLTHLALAGRDGHLTPSDQKLMQRQSRLWPGALEISDESIVDAVIRFETGEMNDPGEVQRLTGVAYRVVKIAHDFVRRAEAARLAIVKGQPLGDLAEEGSRNWYGTWSTAELPGPNNDRW
jgi:hypothetical protein